MHRIHPNGSNRIRKANADHVISRFRDRVRLTNETFECFEMLWKSVAFSRYLELLDYVIHVAFRSYHILE